MEQLLALEMIRVTEAAAIESARFMGRGDRHGADRAATEAMRAAMDELEMAGTIVIGEGERDEAPMLYIGEQVGRHDDCGPAAGRRGRHRGRPARGHEPRRHGPGERDHGDRGVGEGRPGPRPGHLPREAVRRARSRPARSTSRSRPPRTSGRIAEALGRKVSDITVVILDRPRHEDADRGGPRRPARGSSSSPTATCRPRSAARSRGRASTR